MIPGLIVLLFGLYEAATNPALEGRERGLAAILFGGVSLFLGMFFVSNP